MMTRCALFALVALLCLSGVSCKKEGGNGNRGDSAKVKVGLLYIGTGENSAYGEYTKQGLDLALAEIGTPTFELIYKDTKADPQEAVRVFKELQSAGTPIVLGPFTSTEVRQVGPEAQRNRTVMVTMSATADDLSTIGDHLFMMLPPNSQQGADQARFAAGILGVKSAAVLYRQNPYGETLRKAFIKQFEESGGKIVADTAFPDGEENFRDRLRPIIAANPAVIFIPAHDADTGRILRQAQELNVPPGVKFLGCDGSMSDTTLKLAGDAANGAIFSNVASVSPTFDKAYRAKYGKSPNPYAAAAYDTLMIVNELIVKGAKTSDDFEKGLTGLTGHEGATGITKFTLVDRSYWALSKPYRQFEVRAGQFELMVTH